MEFFLILCNCLSDPTGRIKDAYPCGQVDLAETDENENERRNENEKGNGCQEDYKCGIGPRPCKLMIMRARDSVVHPETYHRLKTGCSFELYNILGQHTQKICLSGVW